MGKKKAKNNVVVAPKPKNYRRLGVEFVCCDKREAVFKYVKKGEEGDEAILYTLGIPKKSPVARPFLKSLPEGSKVKLRLYGSEKPPIVEVPPEFLFGLYGGENLQSVCTDLLKKPVGLIKDLNVLKYVDNLAQGIQNQIDAPYALENISCVFIGKSQICIVQNDDSKPSLQRLPFEGGDQKLQMLETLISRPARILGAEKPYYVVPYGQENRDDVELMAMEYEKNFIEHNLK